MPLIARVFLWGMPGSGKTTTGKLVAETLQVPFFDLDELIEEQAGRSVREIFSARGETDFRKREREALTAFISQGLPRYVLATGGGTPCFYDNAGRMQAAGTTVWLQAPLAELERRTSGDTSRPLLQQERTLKALWHERQPAYRKAALHIDTAGLTPSEVASRIVRGLWI